MNNETRKAAVTIAAAIFAARALSDWDGKRSPRLVAGVANALEKTQFLVSILEDKTPGRGADSPELGSATRPVPRQT